MERVRKRISLSNSNNLTIPYNGHAVILGLIIFLNLDGFYLLTDFAIAPTDIAVVLELGYVAYILFTRRNRCEYRYKWAMLMPVVLMITSSIMANYSYNQPIWYGIRAQRTWVCAMLMYFPVTKLVKRGELTPKSILAMLDVVNFIYIILVLLQYLLGDSVQILSVMMTERYGTARLYVSLSFVFISYFVHLMNALEARRITFLDVFFIALTLFLNFAVTKSRMAIVCLLAGTILAVFSIKLSTKKLALVLIVVIAVVIFLMSDMGTEILNLVFNDNVVDTAQIRDEGREFFLAQTLSDWKTALFGCGYANIDWPQTVIGIRYEEGIFANDNGIFGLFFYYGFAFVIWTIYLYIRLLINAWKVNRALFFLLFADIISIYTLFPMSYQSNIVLALVCCMIEACEHKRVIA